MVSDTMWLYWLSLALLGTPLLAHLRYNIKARNGEVRYQTSDAVGCATLMFGIFSALRIMVMVMSHNLGDQSLVYTVAVLVLLAHAYLWRNFRKG